MKTKILLMSILVMFVFSFAYAGDNRPNPRKHFQTSVTVTNVASYIMTENLAGRSILIQNNDAVGIVYVNMSGVATVSATMIRLDPDDSIYLSNISNAVSAIGSIGSNANVAISEGK